MRLLTSFSLVALLAVIVLFTTMAQDDEIPVPDDYAQVIVQQADSGTFTEIDDTTYTLTLTGVSEELTWFIESPWLNAGTESIFLVSGSWAAAEDLVAEDVVLHTGNVSVILTLTTPGYDEDTATMTYTATITEIRVEEETADDKTPPETFEAATLFIRIDAEFTRQLVSGALEWGEGSRYLFTELACIMARCG